MTFHTSESHPADLEYISNDRKISACKNEEERETESDPRGARVLPAEQRIEEGVIVCNR